MEQVMERIILNSQKEIATITLNRPHIYNALDFQTVFELEEAVKALEKDGTTRMLVIRGAGDNFSAGADLKYLLSIISDPKEVEKFIVQINNAFNRIENAPFPVLAVVKGYALAGGFELMQACDLVVAASESIIGDQHANFGLIPGGGGTQRLPRLIGKQKAKEILFTAKWMSGKEAEAYGLVFKAVPTVLLEETVNELVARIKDKSRNGLRLMKYLVNQTEKTDLYEGIELEIREFCKYMQTEDPQEGLTAFSHKRAPAFK